MGFYLQKKEKKTIPICQKRYHKDKKKSNKSRKAKQYKQFISNSISKSTPNFITKSKILNKITIAKNLFYHTIQA